MVFNLLKRNDKVYTVSVPNAQTVTLLPIIREQVKTDSIVYTDCYKSIMMCWISANSTISALITTRSLLRQFNGALKAHFKLYFKNKTNSILTTVQ